jgi:precorrin-2 methylase
MDRVESSHAEIHTRLNTMEFNTNYVAKISGLVNFCAQVRSEIAALETELNAAQYRSAWSGCSANSSTAQIKVGHTDLGKW